MNTPVPLHPAPSDFRGTIHFANGCAYIELNSMNLWPLLILDAQLTGMVNLAVLGQTATALGSNHQEGDTVEFSGVVLVQAINGRSLPVLHIVQEII
jgi:hypothetical protein